MTDYKATSGQWNQVKSWSKERDLSVSCDAACILELRARVEDLEEDTREDSASTHFIFDGIIKRIEGLEAAANLRQQDKGVERVCESPSTGSLVIQVARALRPHCPHLAEADARTAIREVAAWMTGNPDHHFPPTLVFALEQEVEQ